jgi:hypothetical protein
MSTRRRKKKEEFQNCTIPNLYDEFHQEVTFYFERIAVPWGEWNFSKSSRYILENNLYIGRKISQIKLIKP